MAAAAALLLASCERPGASITVDREILFAGVEPRVDAMAKTGDGGFVVMGTGNAAWVVAMDGEGNRLWQYDDPVDASRSSGQSPPQSEFHGAVPMANGNTLLCGGKLKGSQTNNLLVILDVRGSVVEQRVEVPISDSHLTYSNFYQCFPWHDGIVLLGNANDGTHGYIWMVELDGNGVTKRQTLVDNAPAPPDGTVDDQGFVFTAWDAEGSFRVIKTNETGRTLAKRVIAGDSIVQLRSIVATGRTSILVYRGDKATLHTLDERLQDAEPPRDIKGYFDPQAGRGYVLADGSVVLFARDSNAAIGLLNKQGRRLAIREFGPTYKSLSVSDAVPVSAEELVTVRGSVSEDPKARGLVVSWVRIQERK
jgi:hypothetical protein